MKENSAKYNQMHYVSKLHRRGELQVAEYALLAHQPHIIGPEVFGAVEEVERPAAAPPSSSGAWRWTFKPAGVDVEGPQVESRAEADSAIFATAKEALRGQLTVQLQQANQERWLEALRLQAEVVDLRERLNRDEDDIEDPLPRTMG